MEKKRQGFVSQFRDLLWGGLYTEEPDAQIGVLGVPFEGGISYRRGTAFAPGKIREIFRECSPSTDDGVYLGGRVRVRDYGDVPNDLEWERYFQAVEDMAADVLRRHPFALFLGGDHSVTIPLVAGLGRVVEGNFGVIHFDAHTDLADEYDGHRWSHACTERRTLELPNFEPRHLVFVGIRAWMEDEREFLDAHPEITVHTSRDIYRRGIEAVAEDVVKQLRDVEAVYFTLDIDGLDPAYAPGTGIPRAGGPSTRELLELLRIVFEGLPVRALDVVEVSPALDHADITSFAAAKVIVDVFGHVYRKTGGG